MEISRFEFFLSIIEMVKLKKKLLKMSVSNVIWRMEKLCILGKVRGIKKKKSSPTFVLILKTRYKMYYCYIFSIIMCTK